MTTFAAQVIAAEHAARALAAPFTPSRAQHEQALAPVVAELRSWPQARAQAYIRESYTHAGLMPLAVALFKEA